MALLQAKLTKARQGKEQVCLKQSETTPWLEHTGWPQLFRNRPIDIISTSAQLPGRAWDEDYELGPWRGITLCSSAAKEAELRLLVRAVDHMFDRAKAIAAYTL